MERNISIICGYGEALIDINVNGAQFYSWLVQLETEASERLKRNGVKITDTKNKANAINCGEIIKR